MGGLGTASAYLGSSRSHRTRTLSGQIPQMLHNLLRGHRRREIQLHRPLALLATGHGNNPSAQSPRKRPQPPTPACCWKPPIFLSPSKNTAKRGLPVMKNRRAPEDRLTLPSTYHASKNHLPISFCPMTQPHSPARTSISIKFKNYRNYRNNLLAKILPS